MLKHLFVVLFLLIFGNSFSQQIIKSRLLNHGDGKPIPYANIGIMNSSVGTLSNEDGTFMISIPAKHGSDTLIFAALGYERQFVPVQSFVNKEVTLITLTEKVTTLEQVVVSAKKKKEKSYSLGNRYAKGGFLYADSASAGAAMALLIENKYPAYHAELTWPYYLETVNLLIDKNSINNFKVRLRLLERDSISGQPTKDLISEDIIITSSIKRGWIEVNLRPYRIVINKPFYLVFEWIMDDRDRLALLNQYADFRRTNPDKVTSDSTVVDGKKIGFWSYHNFSPGTHVGISPIPFSLQNYTCYYRTNSFGEWRRAPVILTARVEVIPAVESRSNLGK
jgi:hypothetical protein